MPASSPGPPNSFNVAQGLNTPSQALATPGMLSHIPLGGEELDLLDMKDFDGFDLANWVTDVDLDTFGSSWDIQ